MKSTTLVLFVVVCLMPLLSSCYKPSIDLDTDFAIYKDVIDFPKSSAPLSFDYAFVARDTAAGRDKKVHYFDSKINGFFTILDTNIDAGDTVTLSWSGNGELLFITIIKKLTNENSLYEFNTITKRLSELPVKTDLHYAPIYKVESNYDGSFLFYLPRDNDRTPEDLCYDRASNSVMKLSSFLIRNNLLTLNPEYWFFQPSDSNLLDYHTHFVRWENAQNVTLKRSFWRKTDTVNVHFLYNYRLNDSELIVLDSAKSAPDTYRFDSDFYYTYSNDYQQFNRVQKSTNNSISRNEVFINNHSINFIVEIPETKKVLIQQTKRLTAFSSAKRVKLLNYETGFLAKVLPNVEHVIFSDVHIPTESLYFECYFNSGNEIVIIKTDYNGENPEIVSNFKHQVNWFRIRPEK